MMGLLMFVDRTDAGRRLATALRGRVTGDVVVLGIPRGGVIVAAEGARALDADLDVVVPRKIGAPQNPELAIGAIAPGVRVWDEGLIARLRVDPAYLARAVDVEELEIERRTSAFRAGRDAVSLAGRTVVVVDDGVATGSTAIAALRWARASGAARTVLAVPVAPFGADGTLAQEADDVVVLHAPRHFRAVGEWYERFEQTTDDEVVSALKGASS
jgi:predicted phosphoribosyltransferase